MDHYDEIFKQAASANQLRHFIAESNRIEGILREPKTIEITAHMIFLALDRVTVPDLEGFVSLIEPGARLRRHSGMDVRMGNHIAPFGGPEIEANLNMLLWEANEACSSPYKTHQRYETLHPFTDGNGRSGRALWLWTMSSRAPLGFLHTWYYQSLEENRDG